MYVLPESSFILVFMDHWILEFKSFHWLLCMIHQMLALVLCCYQVMEAQLLRCMCFLIDVYIFR